MKHEIKRSLINISKTFSFQYFILYRYLKKIKFILTYTDKDKISTFIKTDTR